MRIFIIGSGVDADYSSPLTFVTATLSSIKSDSDAPYIGLLQNHRHSIDNIPYEYESQVVTDATHYYEFRPQGIKWEGSISSGDCVILSRDFEVDINGSLPPYTKIRNCVITMENQRFESSETIYIVNEALGCKFDSCLFEKFSMVETHVEKTRGIYTTVNLNTERTIFSNCVFNNFFVENSGALAPDNVSVFNTYGNYYNCIFQNMSGLNYTSQTMNIGNTYRNCLVDNSGIDILVYTSFNDIQNCVFRSSDNLETRYKTNNCLDYDYKNDLSPGTYHLIDDTPLKESGIYPNYGMPALNLEYWPYTWYDIGPLYYKKDALVLTQNNQSIILKVNI